MTTHRGEVPGKLMLAGEYAVLHAPACAVAGATVPLVRWLLTPAATGTITVHAYGQVFLWRPGDPAPQGIAGFVEATVQAFGADALATHALTLEVGGQVGGHKLGLGTSAAVAVATGRAICAARGVPFDGAALRRCEHAHRAAQGGRGSGYDVFAIGAGGLSRYDRTNARVERLRWPDGLFAVALYAGSGADTREAIGGRIQPGPDDIERIGTAERGVAEAFRDGDAAGCLRAIAHAEAAFAPLVARSTWLQHAGLAAIAETVARAGGVMRTSGAGGGDCALGVFDSVAAREAAADAWEAGGGLVVARWPEALWPDEDAVTATGE